MALSIAKAAKFSPIVVKGLLYMLAARDRNIGYASRSGDGAGSFHVASGREEGGSIPLRPLSSLPL